jgi:hypothetical protein
MTGAIQGPRGPVSFEAAVKADRQSVVFDSDADGIRLRALPESGRDDRLLELFRQLDEASAKRLLEFEKSKGELVSLVDRLEDPLGVVDEYDQLILDVLRKV